MSAATEYVVSEWEDRGPADAQACPVNPLAFARLIAEIRETARAREDMMRAETRLILQAKAIQRRLDAAAVGQEVNDIQSQVARGAAVVAEGDPSAYGAHESHVSLAALSMLHLEESRLSLHKHRAAFEHRLEKLAKQLPIWDVWAAGVRGFGAMGLAQIIGECGDLRDYPNPAKIWKRMGLGVIEGERQRRVAGAAAIEHGYVPRRRAIMWNIGNALIKGNRDGEYRTYYLAEKERQRAKLPDAPQAHVHHRAQRHMEKRLLKHLWQAWRASLRDA